MSASACPSAGEPPQRLVDTDWLHHRLEISGPSKTVAAFAAAARGGGIIPWQLDLDRIEEDLFHRLIAPPPPQPRSLSLVGARALASQLREAVAARHDAAVARVGLSRACPLDLYALVPVPSEVLRLGPDDQRALAWLWENWGTTDALRHVAVEPAPELRLPLPAGTASLRISFWSADWTPWRAFAVLQSRWPDLTFGIRPTYDMP
ncbi:MAG: hypothetical protein ACRYHQ_41410 [Janthinobacterium lividum]